MKHSVHKRVNKLQLLGLFLLTAFFAPAVVAQVKITGKVTTEKGLALSNVSVSVKGSTAGTSSNADGAYTFTATLNAGKATLLFSAVGYQMLNR